MDTPKDICNKYCKQRLQKLVDDKPCLFSLVSSETEMAMGELSVRTVCEGYLETTFKTIIDRISKVTKNGIEIIKEIIKHEKIPVYRSMPDEQISGPWKVTNPNITYPQVGDVISPWTYTNTIANLCDTITTDSTKFPNKE